MSKISRKQIQLKKQYNEARKQSILSKDEMDEKYAKNVLMMEKLQNASSSQNQIGESNVLNKDQDQGGNNYTEGEEDKEQKAEEEQRSSSPTRENILSHRSKKDKEVNQEYIKACLASAAVEKEKKSLRDVYSKDVTSSDRSLDSAAEVDPALNNPEQRDIHYHFRRDSISSFSAIDDPADRSLCSTDDGVEKPPTLFEKLLLQVEELIQYIQQYENLNRFLAIIMFYVIGVVFYSFHEEWSVSDTIYFITVSITTVGFGMII